MEQFRRRIRGTFSALVRPTMISTIRSEFSENVKLFDGAFFVPLVGIFSNYYSLAALEKLFEEGQLAGSLQGRGQHAVYVPFSFERSRLKWVL